GRCMIGEPVHRPESTEIRSAPEETEDRPGRSFRLTEGAGVPFCWQRPRHNRDGRGTNMRRLSLMVLFGGFLAVLLVPPAAQPPKPLNPGDPPPIVIQPKKPDGGTPPPGGGDTIPDKPGFIIIRPNGKTPSLTTQPTTPAQPTQPAAPAAL